MKTRLIEMINDDQAIKAELKNLNADGEKFRYVFLSGTGTLSSVGFPVVTGYYDTVRCGTLPNFTWGSNLGSEFVSDGIKWVVIAKHEVIGNAEYPTEVRFLAMKIADDVTMDDEAKVLVSQAARLMFSDPAMASEWAHKVIIMMYEMRTK